MLITELSLKYQATLFDATRTERPQYVASLLNRSGSGQAGTTVAVSVIPNNGIYQNAPSTSDSSQKRANAVA
jgi:hypothetical protein